MVFTTIYNYFYPVSHSETANGIHYLLAVESHKFVTKTANTKLHVVWNNSL